MARKRLGTDPGRYDQRVRVFKRASGNVNADGQDENPDGETLVARRWASVLPVTGNERTMVGANQADVTHAVKMHSDSVTQTIAPEMWVKLGDGTRLDISSAFDVELRGVEIQLNCNKRV